MIIGLTGSFGTGKTFVASIFRRFGAKVIDADILARKALEKRHVKVAAAFGKEIMGKGRNIDRRKLAKIVFANKSKLKRLNSIIHPEVIKEIRRESANKTGKGKVAVIDAPLLVEAGLVGLVDKLVVVKASRANQVKRCIKKFGMRPEDVLKRIKCQISIDRKIELADFVIDNDGTKPQTRKQVMKVWEDIWR